MIIQAVSGWLPALPDKPAVAPRFAFWLGSVLCFLSVFITTTQAGDDGAFTKAIESAQARTVKIYGAKIGKSEGYATGILVSPDGKILTARGVYLLGERIIVVLPDGSRHQATAGHYSKELLVATLKIDAKTPEYFDLTKPSAARRGDWVIAVSNAFKVAEGREKLSANLGVVSLRTRLEAKRGVQDVDYQGDLLLVDSITSTPGAPGGAVVDAQGRLVGMIGKELESKGTGTRLNYAIPVDQLVRFLQGKPPVEPVAQTGEPGETGIRLFTLAGKRAAPYIDRVLPGSAAEKAGLKPDDLLLAVGGKRLRTVGDFQEIRDELVAGQEVRLQIKRKEDVLELSLTPEAKSK